MNSFYSNPKNQYVRPLTQIDVAQGDKFYAGQHMDGKWYRVKVNATIDEVTVAAKIVDFGDFTMIPLESLQPLWPQFRNLPMQAISASLAGTCLIFVIKSLTHRRLEHLELKVESGTSLEGLTS